MNILYLIFILTIFCYKALIKFLFKINVYSQEKEDISLDLKKWNFSFRDILYYLSIIIAVIYPLIYAPINLTGFFAGLLFILASVGLYIFAIKNKDTKYAILIDVLFISGLGIQSGCWLVNIVGIAFVFVANFMPSK